ncbi:MAG: RluA family pseudouridine synthase [Fluviibacter sp.]
MAITLESITLVHDADGLLVIDKPAGLLSQPGRRPEKWDSVITRLQPHYPDAVVVHRLDEPTSGLMMLARGQAMSSGLSRAFRERQIHKRYEAIVAGLMMNDQGSIDFPLIADWPNRPRQKIDYETGKPSLTHYWVLERNEAENWTRVDLEPFTGRSHQLRLHLMALGHPILGDPLYADPETFVRAPRMCLHARHLRFDHPETSAPMVFDLPVPF